MNTTPSDPHASVGPRWRRIDRQRVADRRHRRPVRCRAGRDHGRPDHRDVSRLDGRGPDSWRDPDRTACRHPCRRPPATDRSGRIRPRTRSDQAGGGPHGEETQRSSPPLRMRPTCAAGWARRHSTWMRRRTVPGKHSGAPPSPSRLPSQRWPQRTVLITAVDAHTGEPVVFDRHSGVDLADAVAASCASGLPYRIGDSRYIDGGFRRNENADLAAGYGRVLVLSPFGGRTLHPLDWGMQLAAQVDELRAGGSSVETIFPDSNSEHMFGANAMDPSLRPPAARAGSRPRQSPCRAAHRILALTPPRSGSAIRSRRRAPRASTRAPS